MSEAAQGVPLLPVHERIFFLNQSLDCILKSQVWDSFDNPTCSELPGHSRGSGTDEGGSVGRPGRVSAGLMLSVGKMGVVRWLQTSHIFLQRLPSWLGCLPFFSNSVKSVIISSFT